MIELTRAIVDMSLDEILRATLGEPGENEEGVVIYHYAEDGNAEKD